MWHWGDAEPSVIFLGFKLFKSESYKLRMNLLKKKNKHQIHRQSTTSRSSSSQKNRSIKGAKFHCNRYWRLATNSPIRGRSRDKENKKNKNKSSEFIAQSEAVCLDLLILRASHGVRREVGKWSSPLFVFHEIPAMCRYRRFFGCVSRTRNWYICIHISVGLEQWLCYSSMLILQSGGMRTTNETVKNIPARCARRVAPHNLAYQYQWPSVSHPESSGYGGSTLFRS